MGAFGDDVSALVETYTKCLRLLKAFKNHRTDDKKSDTTVLSEGYSRLKTSIRSDRSQVRRAYSAKLSKNGRRLEKGDSRSRLALRHILDRLKSVILNLLDMANTQAPAVDYQSLASLSNSSRIDAIKTMHQLSHRLSSSSSLLRENRRPISPTSSSSRNSSLQGPAKDARHGRGNKYQLSKKSSKARRNASRNHHKQKNSRAKKSKSHYDQNDSSHGSSSSSLVKTKTADLRVSNRISYISTSSDSTKLGEIPYRHSQLVRISSASSDYFNIQPVYPLQPYRPPSRKKGGLLRRFFGNG